MTKITKEMTFAEIIELNPNAVGTLLEKGLHCLGCPMAMAETLEQGCLAHGMKEKDIESLIKEVNKNGKQKQHVFKKSN